MTNRIPWAFRTARGFRRNRRLAHRRAVTTRGPGLSSTAGPPREAGVLIEDQRLRHARAQEALRRVRRGPEVELLLQVGGVRARKPMDRSPDGD